MTKNETGTRLYGPEENKTNIAGYYEKLYQRKDVRWHPYHDEIKQLVQIYQNDRNNEDCTYNQGPTEDEIMAIIKNKQNGKATTDLKNEMLKNTKENFIGVLMPMMNAVWKEEQIPGSWNEGIITSIWKGKGDKESLKNHRGITVSSSIGNIMEEVIDNRIEQEVQCTQAQGGGQKGSSTCDHVFIIRGMIDLALKDKRDLFLTFYDVSKAYDNADVEDMLVILWQKGFKGKVWRLLRGLSENLSAKVKTRYGITRTIKREIGGKQGSRLTGRCFALQMDLISEEMMEESSGAFELEKDLKIGALLWVDDVVSCVEGIGNQEKVLGKIDTFARKHKLEWGQEKCKVMQIGRIRDKRDRWKLGEKEIESCMKYRYLGDVITSDGKNKLNIEMRQNKLQASVRKINTSASSDVMRTVETGVILELHEKINIPSLLTNAESWVLSKTEQQELEKSEIRALKRLFSLPTTTPSVAVVYSFGTLYTMCRIDERQLLYLNKVLNRDGSNWTKRVLDLLDGRNLGWSKQIREKLVEYQLCTDWSEIKNKSRELWRHEVHAAVNTRNRERMREQCTHMKDGESIVRTKSGYILDQLEESYVRRPLRELCGQSKQRVRTVIMARAGMLLCGRNYKGSSAEICLECGGATDDEDHRLNYCEKWKETNRCDKEEKVDFGDIYSVEKGVLDVVIDEIEKVWNLDYGNNGMRKPV